MKEWLGLTPQDFMVYAALLAVAGMYLSRSGPMDAVLAIFALGASSVASLWGMGPDRRLSKASNWIKRVSYPFCLVFVIACIYVNFEFWNR